jgi:hypothetical protein
MMSQSSAERLKSYLTQLPPQAQALLIREFERALERGSDVAVATFVLGELRKIVRSPDQNLTARHNDPARLLFKPLDPFLINDQSSPAPGEIRRQSLAPIWNWLSRETCADATAAFASSVATAQLADTIPICKIFRVTAAQGLQMIIDSPDQRGVARIGHAIAVEDLPAIAAVLANAEALDSFAARLPLSFRNFDDGQVATAVTTINALGLQAPSVLPFALSIVMARLPASWQIIRIATREAFSDDGTRVAANPYGIAVTMVIHGLARVASELCGNIKRGHFADAGDHLKAVHDGIRGLRTELDIRNDSRWGKQIGALKVEVSETLKSEIDSVPGRVRRLLRQRADRDVTETTRLDTTEIEETAALIEFVAICRSFASELAINEVTLRVYSELQKYVEKSTESLVQALRQCDPKVRKFRQQQCNAAIRFCEALFGQEYATLMVRAADNALADERKPARAS